jgi:hypothetical protein
MDYDITDVFRYYELSRYGEERSVWYDCYQAIFRAYGLPVGWDQGEGAKVRGPVVSRYVHHRKKIAQFAIVPFWDFGLTDGSDVDRRISELIGLTYAAPSDQIRNLDKFFFSQVFGVDVDRTFTEEELVAEYRMPNRGIQDEHWGNCM